MNQETKTNLLTSGKINLKKNISSGGSKGGAGEARPPGGPNSFNFMWFLGKFDKFVCWRPPGELAPLLGEILDPLLIRTTVPEIRQFFSCPFLSHLITIISILISIKLQWKHF